MKRLGLRRYGLITVLRSLKVLETWCLAVIGLPAL